MYLPEYLVHTTVFFISAVTESLVFRNTELTQELLQKWYKTRAYQIERDSCIVDNALELIRIGKSHNISGLEELLIELETLDDLVYKIYLEDMSLAQLEKLSDLEKVKLLMSTSNDKNFVANVRNYVVTFARRKQRYLGGKLDKRLLSDYLVTLSENDLTLPAKFFESLKQLQDTEVLDMIEDVVELALDCMYSCVNANMYDRAKDIFDSIPKPLSSRESHGPSTAIEDLERELECLKILNKYNVRTTLCFIRDNKSQPSEVTFILGEMANCLNRTTPPPDENTWAELLNDMLEIHELIFSCVDVEICFEICVSARLASGVKTNIQNCANLIETKRSDQSLLKVSYDRAVDLVLEASKRYFDSSRSLVDPNMELSKACLHLITDDNPTIREEFELINALQILNGFNIGIRPLQVRSCQDRLKLIENCLVNRQDAYKRQQRLLTLANYLRIEGKNKRIREGKVLQLMAHKAYEVGDYVVCASTCQQLIDTNYHPAWRLTQQLGFCDGFRDLHFRKKCLRFSMCYGPTEVLEKTLTQMHLLEIQILNKSLEQWMMEHDVENFEDADDSDDDFTDAMTTPQVEVKEFVPNIIETSSGIVQSSAQIVKQSTLGILKNVSNKSFWKTALNMNSNADSDGSIDIEDDTARRESRSDLPSFPSFYESLHDRCRVSDIDPKYTKYSMPEARNTRLKLCQTLLRVATLSETACYGLEVSDISHFFLQSAKYVMPEDCTLGLSYLLSLSDGNVMSAQEVFRDLPNEKLYNQIAAYYYALQFYRKTHSEVAEAFFYEPIDLIRGMLAKANGSEESELQKALLSWGRYLTEVETGEIGDGEDGHASPTESIDEADVIEVEEEVESYVDSGTRSDQTVIAANLYEKESFKIKPSSQAEEDAGWDDNWGDFSEHSEEEIIVEEVNPIPVDEPISEEKSHAETIPGIDCTEHQRFRIFEELSSNIATKEQYLRMKGTLLQWPKFTEAEFTTVEKHPILRMLEILKTVVTPDNTTNFEAATIEEYKQLLQGQTVSEAVSIFLIL